VSDLALIIRDKARAELARRNEMAAMKDEAEQDLLSFVRMMWPVIEPEVPLVEGWLLDALADVLMAITDGHLTRVSINVPPGSMKSSMLNIFWPAWEWGPQKKPNLRYLSVSYSTAIPERDNLRFARVINHPVYQRCWGDQFKIVRQGTELVENDRTGWKRVTSTGGSMTGHRGDRLLCDDLNNPMNVESDDVRESTVRFVREIMPDRLNDMKKSAIINLQQRTHQSDATGTLIEHGQDYVFVSVPMEFDPLRICSVVLEHDENGEPANVWTDPRALDEDGNILEGLTTNERGEPVVRFGSPMAQAEGELCWPERFPADVVEKLKLTKGTFAWDCNPHEAPILMADLTMKPIGCMQVGDEVVGFEIGCDARRKGEAHAKRRLIKATVLAMNSHIRPVVKITLDSGRVIRCTENHKWFTGRTPKDKTHPLYAPAKVGRPLMRVCDPSIPELTDPELIRAAGWLAGFFDGEGTVSINLRREHAQRNALISFAQTEGRNLNICEELEHVLDLLGFEWGMALKRRHEGWDRLRMYWLKRGGLPVYQRFLHMVKPLKWRQRLIDASFACNFIRGEERVVSIEPDGEEMVYGLTTTTGNYVAWGLACSNSQYQQIPGIRGGSIIKRDWWRLWLNEYPDLGTVIVSLDTAVELNEQNDYNACTVWGAFAGVEGEPLLLLLAGWRARLPLAQLVERVAETCRERKADYLIIEHKTRGRDVADEIMRLYQARTWETVLIKPQGDKASRLKAVEHLFSGDARKDPVTGVVAMSGGMIYAPDRDWADEIISEVAAFPYGSHDDYVDTVSMALGWVRKNGVILRKTEYLEAELERNKYRKPMSVPYSIKAGN